MQEVLPGVYHWRTMHPNIHAEVSSYWLSEPGVLIDPLISPTLGLDWFAQQPTPPSAILLSNRHHYRDSAHFAQRFGARVYCNSAGLHEFSHGEVVEGFEVPETLPGGVVAHALGAICPDDSALHLPDKRALLFADGVVRGQDGPLGFVPDNLMDDPAETKRGLLGACERLLDELDFDHLLLAHGGPLIDDGREQLEQLVQGGGRTAFELG